MLDIHLGGTMVYRDNLEQKRKYYKFLYDIFQMDENILSLTLALVINNWFRRYLNPLLAVSEQPQYPEFKHILIYKHQGREKIGETIRF